MDITTIIVTVSAIIAAVVFVGCLASRHSSGSGRPIINIDFDRQKDDELRRRY